MLRLPAQGLKLIARGFGGAAMAFALLNASVCASADPGTKASHPFGAWGVDLGDQDRAVRPGDDFYTYQNGKWLAQVQFGPNEKAQAYWRELRVLTPVRMGQLLDGLAGQPTLSTKTREGKAAAVYRAYIDGNAAGSKGMAALAPRLAAIRNVRTKEQMAFVMGRIAGPGTLRAWSVYGRPTGWSFFRLDNIGQDQNRLDRYAVYMAAGGLPLPGPEYFLDPQFAKLRQAYVTYIAKTLQLEHWSKPQENARRILDLETRIARVSWTHEQMLDQVKTYNPIAVDSLTKFAPGFPWRAFMKGADLQSVGNVVIDARSAFPKIAAIYAAAPIEVLKARQAFGVADQHSDLLGPAMLQAAIDFRGDALGDGVYNGGGPLKFRAEKEAEAEIPDILAAFYVERYSSPDIKDQVTAMSENMRRALDVRLQSLSWMTPANRAIARRKLADMKFNIGFPDHFDDYAKLDVRPDDVYGNDERAAAYQWHALVAKLGQPFDRSSWAIQPEYATFNYVPTTNTMEIPAALLVSPFFDLKADNAVNYGSVGTTIGAMITAPFFTKQGLQYDANGRLHPWLSAAESAKFDAISSSIARQYSAVESLPGLNLKGELLADEALGDLTGLDIALDAYHLSLNGKPAPILDGYTGDQRFFLGRAQMWQAKFVESFIRSQTVTGSNEPPFMRVNGLLPNMDRWYAAFNVTAGEKLYINANRRVTPW